MRGIAEYYSVHPETSEINGPQDAASTLVTYHGARPLVAEYYSLHPETSHIKGPQEVASTLLTYIGSNTNTPLVVEHVAEVYNVHQGNPSPEPADVASTVTARYGTGGGNAPLVVSFSPNVPRLGEVGEDETNPLSVEHREAVCQGAVLRRLTPIECLRLQGMPDDWCEVPGKPISDSAIYRMTGNAVTASVARWIGLRARSVVV